jgi:galactokinase
MHDIASVFAAEFGRQPRVFSAPGRVNWIGEHTDYNDGFVLPFAMDRRTHVAAAPREDGRLRVFSHDLGERATTALEGPLDHRLPHWMEYVLGVARVLAARGHPVTGADLAVRTDVPMGADSGPRPRSRSRVGYALLALAGTRLSHLDLALAAQGRRARVRGDPRDHGSIRGRSVARDTRF